MILTRNLHMGILAFMRTSPPPSAPAVLLVGGLGTRLRHLTADRPKALVNVAGRPFIEWQILALQEAGVDRIHLAAGYLAEQLEEWAARFRREGQAEISVEAEPEPLGTGGGLQFAAKDLVGERLLVVNGDTLLPRLDLRGFLRQGRPGGATARMVVVESADAARFGTVRLREDGSVAAFIEKGRDGPGWINGGFYLLDRSALMAVKRPAPWSLETDWFPELAAAGQLIGVPAASPLLDMGTPEGFAEMERFLKGR